MSEDKSTKSQNDCPTCGEPIPEDTPGGLCPACVLGAAAVPTEPGGATDSTLRFEAPAIDQIAAAFPTLEIVELIGCGGMGAVYKARQPHLDRDVALKILPPSLAETPEFTNRFSREGRLLARLNHPNIVSIYDFGETGGYFFLLMEFVDGVNLRQAMRAGKFTPDQALDIVPKVCKALQFAHDEGILHRDIKPENILLDTKGRVKIADFGIAKMVGDPDSPTITRTAAPGTPQYMAPEQVEQPGKVDHRADIYSLGVVFYEMLTGELPIGRFSAPSEKASVGSEIDDIVFRALEKERDLRQQSADEIRTEISDVPPLTDVPHPGIGGVSNKGSSQPDDPKNRPALALTLTFLGLIFPIILLFASVGMASHTQVNVATKIQSERLISSRTSQVIYDTKNEIASAEKNGATMADLQKLKRNLESAQRQDERLKSQRKNIVKTEEIKLLPLLISAFALLPLCALPGTVFGWLQLRRQRILGIRSGRPALIAAAWFWPMLAIVAFVFSLILLPATQGPGWMEGVGISLSLIVSIVAGAWLIRRTLKWLNTPPSAADRSHFADLERKQSHKRPLKQRRLLYSFTCASAISLALLIILGSVGQFVYSARGGSNNSLIPAMVTVGIVLVLFSLTYYLLISKTYGPKKALPHPNYNPWPKRVFWLVAAVFIGPSILVGIALLIPLLSRVGADSISRIQGNHAVAVRSTMSRENHHLVQFEFVNKTSEIVRAEVSFDGTPLPDFSGFRDGLSPGDIEVIEIMPGKNEIEIAFNLPDSHTTKVVGSELQLLHQKRSRRPTFYEDLEILPIFRVEAKPQNYTAMIHFLPPAESSSNE